ncbi:MAG: hypothetical protein R3B81_16910 [bacterium]
MSSCRRRILPLATVVLAGVAAAGFGDASAETLAGFADSTAWRLLPSDGVEAAWVAPAPGAEAAVRFAFGGGGWFILRQDLDLPLPANWEFSFRVAGDAPPNNLEFKLVDPSGENVWWSVRRDFVFRREGETVRVKKRHVSFAWGPRGGGDVDRLGAIEIAVSAGAGGSGTLEFSDLRWRELPERTGPPSAPWATATSFAPDAAAALAVDGDPATAWRAAAGDPEGAITLAFPGGREFSALFLDWGAGADVAYRVDAFSAGVRTSIGIAETGPRGIHRYWCPESDADSLRISITSGVAALHEVELVAPEDVADRNAFFGLVASRAPRGTFPRSFSGEQSYWTIVGADGGENVALFGEDGELELAPGGFSVAPWIEIDGRRQDWSRASESAPTLADAGAPVPTVEQRFDDHTLRVTAIPGATDAEPTAVRLRVENQGRVRSRVRLGVAIRPFQVNPPTQFLAVHGGAARVRDLEIEAGVAIVDGTPRVAVLGAPDGAGVADFERGEILERVRAGALPACTRVRDPLEAASGAFVFDRSLAPGEVFEIGYLATAGDSVVVPEEARDNPVAWLADTERAAVDRWRDRVAHVRLELPEDATGLAATFRAQLAYVLVNRAGPAIRPGSRSYRRSWIRDGALTSSALLRAGEFDVPREFLRWYAPYQYEDGKIPCVVDWRGADPVPEHDSNGEFVFLVAEILRYTGIVRWPRRCGRASPGPWTISWRSARSAPGRSTTRRIVPCSAG